MINKNASFWLLLGLFLQFGCAQKQPITQAQTTSPFKEIDMYLQAQIDTATQSPVAGIAIAIVEGRHLVHAKAFGVTNIQTKQPLQVDHNFHIASISKTFAATAIMQLVERGKVGLDERLVSYLPYFSLADAEYKNITLRQILNHSSGMGDVENYEWDKAYAHEDAAERWTRSLSNEKLIAMPGSAFHYSNMAYDLLADVVAKVTGESFEKYVKDHILTPLQMKESSFLLSDINPSLRTSPHMGIPLSVSQVYPYNRMHAASSTLNSNVMDLSHWIIANLDKGTYKGKRILSANNIALMHTSSFTIDSTSNKHIGLSWFINSSQGVKVLRHDGGDDGYSSTLHFVPSQKFGFVILCNSDEANVYEIKTKVLDLLLAFYTKEGKRE
jgi:CubicO group peptidase (beta-lactamase class C family)